MLLVLLLQVLVYSCGSLTTCTHRENNGCCACDSIATCKDSRARGLTLIICNDTATASGLEVCTNPQIVSENGIKSINIPLNVKSIGDAVFIECSQLERVTIPSTVESFGQTVFAFCNKLSTVYINVKFKNYQDVANIFEGTNLITSTDFDQCPAIKWTE